MYKFKKSLKLTQACYEIRGEVVKQANILEAEGHRIYKLNIGNPAPFGFEVPEEIVQDVKRNLSLAQGYSESKGIFSARKAIMHDCQRKKIQGVEIEDIFIGNGVSELILMSMHGLLNNGDEVLIPSPDYPLWTASVHLAGGKPVHYRCDESNDWEPDLDDLEQKISKETKAIVVINPNNPTGAVYSKKTLEAIIEMARKHSLIIYADEIYDQIVYDENKHYPMASLADDVVFVTFNGLSKVYRAAGFRSGWMVVSGAKHKALDYMQGLEMLASMRLCSNVPVQHAIQTALGGYQSIQDLVRPGGRLYEQRELAYNIISNIPGVSCVKPKGAMYLFPKMDPKMYPIERDSQWALDLLKQQKVLVVQGSGFNLNDQQHFRIVFLPRVDELKESLNRISEFLDDYRTSIPSQLASIEELHL
ncbi:MAG: pyridoxal phosphate-dependent aminotransferase [Bdellovibrionales bacterium]|nr:pyridoxal phosphate-dependent aminotransferase [Bdellovibrionales bacterium]